MNEYRFTIYGNQENLLGNPIPYFRQTQRSSKFNKGAIRYHEWKDYVRSAINDCCKTKLTKSNLLVIDTKACMKLNIFFKSKIHADSDNIFKGIADSLFENDKYLSGSFDFSYSNEPRVEVVIEMFSFSP